MDLLPPHWPGLEVHEDMVVACVRHTVEGRVKRELRSFKTTTQNLMALSERLPAEGGTDIVMEATGISWKPV
jgi:transposase